VVPDVVAYAPGVPGDQERDQLNTMPLVPVPRDLDRRPAVGQARH
jgi:hypothetical protein